MRTLKDHTVKLLTDGADKAQILDMAKQGWIAGFAAGLTLAPGAPRAAE